MSEPSGSQSLKRAAQVIVVGSVMFTFISYWRTAAVVLCDLASTAYYVGGIAEQAIGPAAPWFILAVMIFSYTVRNVYIESCSMFVRGGVYRVVREAMGSFMGKVSVSALIFDYVLTGPISSVSAGQYVFGWLLEMGKYLNHNQPLVDLPTAKLLTQWGSVIFAICVTSYFFWQNLKGIHESSDKAFKIMIATTIMAVLIIGWCGTTLAIQGRAPVHERDYKQLASMSPERKAAVERNSVPLTANFSVKQDYNYPNDSNKKFDPLGFLSNTSLGERLHSGNFNWLGIIGVIGIIIAFGHSILGMSGYETLAQVYREVEAPKLPNFRKAAFIVFIYSLSLTSVISFLAVLLIPDDVRMPQYSQNLIGGLSMHVIGPVWAKLILNAFVVVVGALILSGAVNTAIIGSNGVLNRVAEDGVLPDWLRKPHPKYGTSYRILFLILVLQLTTIIASRGDVLLLGEAYAFGVVWSFVFMTASMVILRFKDKTPRDFRMPLNIRLGSVEVPLGLMAVFCVLAAAALSNLLTKDVATVSGLSFTGVFLVVFTISEWFARRARRAQAHGDEHLEQFTIEAKEEMALSRQELELPPKPYLKLIAIRSPQNLFMLEKSLAETDPETTNVVVMTAKVLPQGDTTVDHQLGLYEQQLMTAVVDRAEKAGKHVMPLIVPTNNPLNAVLSTARDLHAQEIVMGASNKYATDMQLEEVQFNWLVANGGNAPPISVRILGRDRDVYLNMGGGSRIPKISERQARSVAELRAAGVGVRRVLLHHDGTAHGSDLYRMVLTMLDPQVTLDFAVAGEITPTLQQDLTQAAQLDREIGTQSLTGDVGSSLASLAQEREYDLVIVASPDPHAEGAEARQKHIDSLLEQARCPVFVARMPEVPRDASKD